MDAEPTFGSDSEAINYWRKLAKERQDDFDELQEMSADYEKEMDATLSKLESEKKTLETQNGRLMQELETYREKQKERHQIAQTEIEKLKDLLNKESDERSKLMTVNRQLEQDLDDFDRRYRQLHMSFESAQELLQVETERNAMLETDQCEYTNMQEMFQRQLDEIRDLKSDREVREKLNKANETKKSSDSRREKIIDQTPPPRGLENLTPVGASGAASPPNSPGVSQNAPPTHCATPPTHNSDHLTARSLTTSPSISSLHSSASSQSRLSALSIVGDLLRKVGALETKLASCRTFVRDNASTIPTPSQVGTPRRTNQVPDFARGEPRSPLRVTPGGAKFSSPLRPSQSYSGNATSPPTPTRRLSNSNSFSQPDSRIGERLANQRSLFSTGKTPSGDRMQNSRSIKLNAP